MRSPACLLALLVTGLFAPLAGAQVPHPFIDLADLAPITLAAPPTPDPAPPGQPSVWYIDLVLGFPTGLRAQKALCESPWMLEGFLGLEVILPTVGVGARRQCVLLDGTCDALLVNPGIDAYLAYVPSLPTFDFDRMGGGSTAGGVAGALAADVDVVWRHTFSGGTQTRIGLKLGVGAASRFHHGAIALPLAALFLGWGF